MTEKKITPNEFQQQVEKDKLTRMQNCQNEIEEVLQKYRCQLVPLPAINPDGRIVAEAQIRAV